MTAKCRADACFASRYSQVLTGSHNSDSSPAHLSYNFDAVLATESDQLRTFERIERRVVVQDRITGHVLCHGYIRVHDA